MKNEFADSLCRRDAWNKLDAGCISDVCDKADNRRPDDSKECQKNVIKRENLKKRGLVDSVLIWIIIIKFITNYLWFIYLWSIPQKIHQEFLIFSSWVSGLLMIYSVYWSGCMIKPLTKPELDGIGSAWITLFLTFCHLVNNTAQGFNPLSPKSDQHQISPCTINAL